MPLRNLAAADIQGRIDVDTDHAARVFEEHRRMLTGLAYRILGSWTEAEDLVQDLWPRWETNAAQ
ncbi:MAG: sigma factor, partial [Stackebrandtia sp.]